MNVLLLVILAYFTIQTKVFNILLTGNQLWNG